MVNNRLRALKSSISATSIVPLCDACNVTSRFYNMGLNDGLCLCYSIVGIQPLGSFLFFQS